MILDIGSKNGIYDFRFLATMNLIEILELPWN